MPLLDFICLECHKKQSILIKVNEVIACKFCKSNKIKKLFGAPNSKSIIVMPGIERDVVADINIYEVDNYSLKINLEDPKDEIT